MIRLTDFKEDAIEQWENGQRQVKTLVDLEDQGVISSRFKRYCNLLVLLEGLSKEAEYHASNKDFLEVDECYSEMRKFLFGIQCNYGQDMIEKPRSSPFYQELWDFAYEKYNDIVSEVSESIERHIK